ncbi:hypothetical protein COM97_27220 [Bacillus thuringiensis]|uniref:hypothetical protein n=1 Tax=Bacillus thuringiensis TaxID=1428 RepID=UPI000BEB4A74|nr:hypothetical protein [Bacillus thuringiensis]PEF03433.1 hypothetical protein COM97_27220 [Bacillus thuringiensis]
MDRLSVVKEKVNKLSKYAKEEVFTKDVAIAATIAVAASFGVQYFATHEMPSAAASLAAFIAGGMYSLGKSHLLRKIKRNTNRPIPGVYTLTQLIDDNELTTRFEVNFYNKNGSKIARVADTSDVYSYFDAVKRGIEGLNEIDEATSFNIEKYYDKAGE